MEAVVKHARTTGIPGWWRAMSTWTLKYFRNSLWFKEKCMIIEAPEEGISTCRSKGPKVEAIERTYDYVIACRSLQGKIKNMGVVADFESSPHEAVAFSWWKETRRLSKASFFSFLFFSWRGAGQAPKPRKNRAPKGGAPRAAAVSHDSLRAQKCAQLMAPALQHTTKFNDKTHRERKTTKWERQREKQKARNFGRSGSGGSGAGRSGVGWSRGGSKPRTITNNHKHTQTTPTPTPTTTHQQHNITQKRIGQNRIGQTNH